MRQGGTHQLVNAVERRVRAPGGSLYLVTTHSGDIIVGNIEQPTTRAGRRRQAIETNYQRRGETGASHPALMRLFVLPGGFRLLVGHDIEDRQVLRRHPAAARSGRSLFWLVLVGALGGLSSRIACSNESTSCRRPRRASWPAIS